jgi:RNA-splicing ligase RtcB
MEKAELVTSNYGLSEDKRAIAAADSSRKFGHHHASIRFLLD